jgi:Protein of unknown function (DUF2914)
MCFDEGIFTRGLSIVMHSTVMTLIYLLLAAPLTRAADPPLTTSAVLRTQFTTAIKDREPVDNLTELNNGTGERIYCFTELKNLTGQVVTHSWEYRGQVMNEARFHVDSAHSRIWSSRLLTPDRPGSWTVIIMSQKGKILAERTLDYNLEEPVF